MCRVVFVALFVAVTGCATERNRSTSQHVSAQQLAERAFDAEDRGETGRAAALLDEAVQIDPTDCETRLQLSELLLKHGDLPTAARHLEQLAERNPDDPRIAFRLAQTRFLMGQAEQAERWLRVGLELDPGNEEGLLLLGRLAEWRGDEEGARATYMRVLDIAPDSNSARIRLAALLCAAGQPNRAAPLARRVLDSEQACPMEVADAQWYLGEAYILMGREIEGESLLTAASKQRTLSADQWYELALAQTRVGRNDEALRSTEQSLAAAPRHPEAVELQGWLTARVPRGGGVPPGKGVPPGDNLAIVPAEAVAPGASTSAP